jgi:hypothetical protein
MKNSVKLVRIIVFAAVTVLLFAGCGEKGGTFEIKNETGDEIYGYAISGYYTEKELNSYKEDENSDLLVRASKTIYKGESITWTFSSNVTVTWCWSPPARNIIIYGGTVKLEKGGEETVTATP